MRGNNTWYLDSGCSKHMTGDKSKFLSLEAYPGGTVTFGDNKKGEVIAKGKVGRSSSHSIKKCTFGRRFDAQFAEHITIL